MTDSHQLETTGNHISHPHIVPESIEYREYQYNIAANASAESSLIALPTAAGKTVIAAMIAAEQLDEVIDSHNKILFLAPFKSLVTQQAQEFNRVLDIGDDSILELTGDVRPDDRSELWSNTTADIVFATPQVVENDILSKRVDLEQISHIFFDECHRTRGNSSYAFIADQYKSLQTDNSQYLVTGMSASPGSSEEEILTICKKLHVTNVEILGEDDDSLSEYLYTPDITEEKITLDEEIIEMRDLLQDTCQERYKELKKAGYLDSARKTLSFGELNAARGKIQQDLDKGESDAYEAISVHAEAMKLYHAVEIIDTQGVKSLESYLESQFDEAKGSDSSKAVKRMCQRSNVKEAYELAQSYDKIHPKKAQLRMYLVDTVSMGGKMILFTEYTDTADDLTDFINSHKKISAEKFVGQQEMSRKKQQEVLDNFREGKFDVLVATSVGEEGLDIPSASTVIFFEPVSSGLRSIQRRGRTARKGEGDVIILIGKGTRDEGKYYASKNKEETMKDELTKLANSSESIQETISNTLDTPKDAPQQSLTDFESDTEAEVDTVTSNVESEMTDANTDTDTDTDVDTDSNTTFDGEKSIVVADSRETNSQVVQDLYSNENVELQVENNLEVADYVVGQEVAIERKTASDLASTITGDRDLFQQVSDMSNSYDRPILLIETDSVGSLYSTGIHPNAIRGVLDSVSSSFGVDVFYTSGESDTAQWIQTLADRTQDESTSEINPHASKQTTSIDEHVKYIVSSIDSIGPVNAERLLDAFGSVESVFTASKEELAEVEGIGPKTAHKIRKTLTHNYDP